MYKENYVIMCCLCLSPDIQPFFLEPPTFVPKIMQKKKKIYWDNSASESPLNDHVKITQPFCHKELIYSAQLGCLNYLT